MPWHLLYNAHLSSSIHCDSTSAEGSVFVQKVLIPQEQPHLYVLTVWGLGVAMGPMFPVFPSTAAGCPCYQVPLLDCRDVVQVLMQVLLLLIKRCHSVCLSLRHLPCIRCCWLECRLEASSWKYGC